jgi:hypothetical protein
MKIWQQQFFLEVWKILGLFFHKNSFAYMVEIVFSAQNFGKSKKMVVQGQAPTMFMPAESGAILLKSWCLEVEL